MVREIGWQETKIRFFFAVESTKNDQNLSPKTGNYNYGQKSWDKLKLFARFLTRKTNSRVYNYTYTYTCFSLYLPYTL